MFEECVQLRALGHQVTLGYNEPGDLLAPYEAAGVRSLRLPTYVPLRRSMVRDTVGLATSLVRTIGLQLDLIVANSYQSTFFGAALARLKRVPLVCHLRLNPPVAVTSPTQIGLRQVSRFIAVSESVRDMWSERGVDPSVIDVVHDGIDFKRFQRNVDSRSILDSLSLPRDRFVILFVGRVDPVKDIEGLLRAFAIVQAQEPRAHLLLAGAPSSLSTPAEGSAYLASLKRMAADLGLSDHVSWLGHRADMPELYAASDVVALFGVIPEPFGRATCEALASGRPMVTPRQGGSVEIMTGEFERFLFSPGDVTAAARLLLDLVDWKRRDSAFADRARAHIRAHFDIELMGLRVEQVLRDAKRAGPHRLGPSHESFRPRSVPRHYADA